MRSKIVIAAKFQLTNKNKNDNFIFEVISAESAKID